ANRSPAAGTGAAGAVVDAPARRAGRVDGGSHEAAGGLERSATLRVADLAERHPGREPSLPQALGGPDVPDACDEGLVLEGLPERAGGTGAPKPGEHRVAVGRRSEDVRTEPFECPCVQLEHRPAPEDALALGAAQEKPRPPSRLCASRPDRPLSAH